MGERQRVRRLTVRRDSVPREPFYAQFGARIRVERERAGLSQAELAETLGLVRASVANIESARQRVLAHQIPPIAAALGCQIERLFMPSVFRRRRSAGTGVKTGAGSRR